MQGYRYTSHERLSSHQRRSTNVVVVPTLVLAPGSALSKQHYRAPDNAFVQEVELIKASPQNPRVRYPNGREVRLPTVLYFKGQFCIRLYLSLSIIEIENNIIFLWF